MEGPDAHTAAGPRRDSHPLPFSPVKTGTCTYDNILLSDRKHKSFFIESHGQAKRPVYNGRILRYNKFLRCAISVGRRGAMKKLSGKRQALVGFTLFPCFWRGEPDFPTWSRRAGGNAHLARHAGNGVQRSGTAGAGRGGGGTVLGDLPRWGTGYIHSFHGCSPFWPICPLGPCSGHSQNGQHLL